MTFHLYDLRLYCVDLSKFAYHQILSLSAVGLLNQSFTNGSLDYTVFAPTDNAFKAAKLNLRSPQCLRAIARNHIVNDVFCTPSLKGKLI